MPERVKEEDKPWEVVYCRAKKCHHHIAGKHHCNIVKPLGNDDKISLDDQGHCENFCT